jgi:hypothetical protein
VVRLEHHALQRVKTMRQQCKNKTQTDVMRLKLAAICARRRLTALKLQQIRNAGFAAATSCFSWPHADALPNSKTFRSVAKMLFS